MAGVAFGPEMITKLQDAGVIPKDLLIRRMIVDIQVDEAVRIYYECFMDKVEMDFCLDEMVKHKDKLVVSRVVEKLDKSAKLTI
jgi:hydrogenase maturation factor